MIVKVIYPSDGSREKSRVEFDVEVTAGADDFQTLERAFRETNFVEAEDIEQFNKFAKQVGVKSVRSSMSGDIFIVNGKYYLCGAIGWEILNKDVAEFVITLDTNARRLFDQTLYKRSE